MTPKHKLLLIEDDKIDQMAFARWMAEESPEFDCTIAGSIAQAKQALTATRYDVIVTDFRLGDGYAFEIFPLARQAPLIVATASGTEEVAVKALKSGAYDYLVKDPERNYLKLLRFTLIRSMERKKAESQLRLLSETVHTMSECVCISNEKDRIIFVNRSFTQTYGYSEEEALTLSSAELWADAPAYEKAASPDRNGVRQAEVIHKRKTGEPFDVSYSQSHLVTDEGTKKVMVIRDITERKHMEGILLQSEKIAAVGQLAAGIAHEINNPLCVILGAAQSVLRRTAADDPVVLMLKSIERETLRSRDLVQNLLSFSRNSPPEQLAVDVNMAVRNALALVGAQLKLTQIVCEKALSEPLPLVFMNANHLQQILINLAGNAIQAMNGKGRLSISTGTAVIDDKTVVFLKVCDTGPGIPPAILPRIFEPFFTTKPAGQGTGLGLALVQDMLKRCNGSITVKSRPGLTEFTIFLPPHP